jgi:hypothetical protein
VAWKVPKTATIRAAAKPAGPEMRLIQLFISAAGRQTRALR